MRRDVAERLLNAEAEVERAELRVRLAQAKAEQARCRVEKLRARTQRNEARRKIVLGSVILLAPPEAYEEVLSELLPLMRESDRALVTSSSEGDNHRRDTQRKAILGGAFITAARDRGDFRELLNTLIRCLERPHDIAL
ncbi:MAG: hypothetical protein ABF727_15805, partial [Gluconobacter oxydans]